mmetsp:Transcript_32640/g.45305  ORF Transcript_32640/g.45305 Transcript_32640/m.45305 type:complete len:380 (-) Transcript_32640:224-1363(-)|eukprot:CAMPEP_0196582502 /NCGR_PEP_ID=MMETSP1081-20130531/39152_1 /TAXON_ID=36882 /ORGANISM="Pyramimonas amylifera, Strain CCMP720" /LENGTH=379 /DNA_ID=CAMNT_0041903079 /DNA_START=210 /DNA_END=1349 /DNA_ORIENTATION=+
MGGLRKHNGRPDHVPRSQLIIRERSEEGIEVFGRTPRGQAKIHDYTQIGLSDRDSQVYSGKSFPMDELFGIDVQEALAHLEQPIEGDFTEGLKNTLDIRTWPASFRHLLAGGYAGSVSKTMTSPIEVTRMVITVGGSKSGSVMHVIKNTWQQGGPGAFFKGNFADVVRVTPQKAVQLAAFDAFKKAFSRRNKETGQKLEPGPTATTVAGACAGVVSTIACFPLEVLRTRLACSNEYAGMVDCLAQMIKKEGVGSLYSGVQPSLVGVIPYAAVNLGMYDGLKWSYLQYSRDTRVPKNVAFICGSISGCFSATVTFPLEVVRRRMMMGSAYKNTFHALYTIAKTEGVDALFKGCVLGWFKLAPSAGLSFYCYEQAKDYLKL